MGTMLPQIVNEASDVDERAIAVGILQRAQSLLERKLSSLTNAQATELDTEAKNTYDAMEAKRVYLKAPMLETIRRHDEFWGSVLQPLKDARAICTGVGLKYTDGGITGRFARQEAERVAVAQREAERLALEAEKARVAAEVEHLTELAIETNDESLLAEVEQLAIAPIEQPAVAPVAQRTVITGISTKVQGRPTFVKVENAYQLLTWMMASKERFESLFSLWFKAQESGFNTSLRNGLTIPGIKTITTYPTSNRSR